MMNFEGSIRILFSSVESCLIKLCHLLEGGTVTTAILYEKKKKKEKNEIKIYLGILHLVRAQNFRKNYYF